MAKGKKQVMSLLHETWTFLRKTVLSLPGRSQAKRMENPSQSKKERQSSHDTMMISNALVARSRNDWIVDLGAASQICND